MENEKKPLFSLENIVKAWFTTILGMVIMGACFYGWFHKKNISDMQAISGGIAGFAILFMRDALPGFITKFFNKKTD
jgi:hypothetical protein